MGLSKTVFYSAKQPLPGFADHCQPPGGGCVSIRPGRQAFPNHSKASQPFPTLFPEKKDCLFIYEPTPPNWILDSEYSLRAFASLREKFGSFCPFCQKSVRATRFSEKTLCLNPLML
jgi:hypothetical protein